MLRTGSNERLFVESEFRLHSPVSAEATEDWEDNVKRDGWTPLHHRVFNKVCQCMMQDGIYTFKTLTYPRLLNCWFPTNLLRLLPKNVKLN